MMKTMILWSFTIKKCLVIGEKVVQFPPCLLNLACSLNKKKKIFHPARLIQPDRLIEPARLMWFIVFFLVNLHFIVHFSTLNFHFQSLCCRGEVDNLKAGGCTIHSRKCGADLGLFIKLSSCHLVILSGKHKGGFFPAPYVDR